MDSHMAYVPGGVKNINLAVCKVNMNSMKY